MRRIFFCFCIALILSGCSTSEVSTQAVEDKADDLAELTRSRIMSVTQAPYVGAVPVPLRKTEFPSEIFNRTITINKTATLDDLCVIAGKLIGLPVAVDYSFKSDPEKMEKMEEQLNAAMQGKQEKSSLAPKFLKIDYEGPVKGFFDLLAARTGLGWDYSSSGVFFSNMQVRTFTLWAVPGKVAFSDKISNESTQGTRGGSSSIGGSGVNSTISTQESTSETSQSHTTTFELDTWTEIKNSISALLTKEGSYSINQSAGTITVRDTAFALRNIGKFIAEINTRLGRQIALSIKVYSLEINDSVDVGLNLSAVFQNDHVALGLSQIPMKWLGLGGEVSATVVDGKIAGSAAMLKALRSIGQATQVTSAGGVVMSNQPVPVQAVRRESYLAGAGSSTTDYGQTDELTPGEVTTGFAMTVIPHILEGRRVILHYTVNLSNLDDLTSFSSGTTTIQLPKVSSRSFSQRMNLKMGQTLILAGFEQEINGKDSSIGMVGFGKSREYKKSMMIITISTESGDV